jgi:hypothetical protein
MPPDFWWLNNYSRKYYTSFPGQHFFLLIWTLILVLTTILFFLPGS